MAKIAYNSSVNRSTSRYPIEIVTGLLSRKPIDLVPLPSCPSAQAEAFRQHIRDIQDNIQHKIAIGNKSYKRHADLRWRFAGFDEGDIVMVRVRPEQYPQGVYKRLHLKSAGPFKVFKKISSNAHVLELPDYMGY